MAVAFVCFAGTTMLAEAVDGFAPKNPIVFASISRPEYVAMFAKDVPGTKFSTAMTDVPLNSPPPKYHNHSLSEYQAAGKAKLYQCHFGGEGLPGNPAPTELCKAASAVTAGQTVTYQVITCAHPPEEARAALVGCPVTIRVNGNDMNSTAVYVEAAALPEHGQAKHHYCACLLMWYRTEFLLEWVWYHTVVHGLEKVFIYDNDSEVDNLEESVTKLKSFGFNIEHVPWNIHKIQPAYHGHCAMLAGNECEWVSFTDIDEFVYMDPKVEGGRLDRLLKARENDVKSLSFQNKFEKSETGGIAIRMVTTSAGDTNMTLKPSGGVVRNYGCTGKSTNWKSIVRPRALHQSMVNAVHYYGYDFPAYNQETYKTDGPIRLFHYKNQAWEVYMRKYVRRASPATRSFKMQDKSSEVSIDNPDAVWAKNVLSQCTQTLVAPIMASFPCKLTPKVCPTTSPDSGEAVDMAGVVVGPTLIVGVGGVGSGLQWVERQLISLKSAAVIKDWETVRSMSPQESEPVLARYVQIVHHVRHPLAAIEAIVAERVRTAPPPKSAAEWSEGEAFRMLLAKVLQQYVMDNQMLEMVADARYRVEDVSAEWLCGLGPVDMNAQTACRNTPFIPPRIKFGAGASASASASVSAGGRWEVTWAMLSAADPQFAQQATHMAQRYGYTTFE
jgi:hypothetical protein